MSSLGYQTYEQFVREVLDGRGVPFNSPVEEMAADLFRYDLSEEDSSDSDDEEEFEAA